MQRAMARPCILACNGKHMRCWLLCLTTPAATRRACCADEVHCAPADCAEAHGMRHMVARPCVRRESCAAFAPAFRVTLVAHTASLQHAQTCPWKDHSLAVWRSVALRLWTNMPNPNPQKEEEKMFACLRLHRTRGCFPLPLSLWCTKVCCLPAGCGEPGGCCPEPVEPTGRAIICSPSGGGLPDAWSPCHLVHLWAL